MDGKDIVFLCETHTNVSSLPTIHGFTIFGDPSFPLFIKHGGLAVYIKNNLAQYINELRFGKCTFSFNISCLPNTFFMGTYVYPIDSENFDDTDYGSMIDDIR